MRIAGKSMSVHLEELKHVYWLGGGSGAGKSTIARHLADTFDVNVYDSDRMMVVHGNRLGSTEAPYLSRFKNMTMDERWLLHTPEEMFNMFHWFRGEGFQLIVEDILKMPSDKKILVEGFRLLPELVSRLITLPSQALWLLPTAPFREAVFNKRGGPKWSFLAKTSDAPRALQRLLARDLLFTNWLENELNTLDLPWLQVSGNQTENDLALAVARHFQFYTEE